MRALESQHDVEPFEVVIAAPVDGSRRVREHPDGRRGVVAHVCRQPRRQSQRRLESRDSRGARQRRRAGRRPVGPTNGLRGEVLCAPRGLAGDRCRGRDPMGAPRRRRRVGAGGGACARESLDARQRRLPARRWWRAERHAHTWAPSDAPSCSPSAGTTSVSRRTKTSTSVAAISTRGSRSGSSPAWQCPTKLGPVPLRPSASTSRSVEPRLASGALRVAAPVHANSSRSAARWRESR